jgi:hypothetical protein
LYLHFGAYGAQKLILIPTQSSAERFKLSTTHNYENNYGCSDIDNVKVKSIIMPHPKQKHLH